MGKMNLFEFLEIKSIKAGKDDVVIFQFKGPSSKKVLDDTKKELDSYNFPFKTLVVSCDVDIKIIKTK